MKKAISIILLVGLLYFLYQLGANFLKNEHSIEYTISTNDKKFSVIEKYNKKNTHIDCVYNPKKQRK